MQRPRRGSCRSVVLVATHAPVLCDMIVATLRRAGVRTIAAADEPAALALLRARRPAVVVQDELLPGDGEDALQRAAPRHATVLLVASGHTRRRAPADAVLRMPFDARALLAAVADAAAAAQVTPP